jgi:hypothetical protein
MYGIDEERGAKYGVLFMYYGTCIFIFYILDIQKNNLLIGSQREKEEEIVISRLTRSYIYTKPSYRSKEKFTTSASHHRQH